MFLHPQVHVLIIGEIDLLNNYADYEKKLTRDLQHDISKLGHTGSS